MLRDNLMGLIEPMRISAGANPLALSLQKQGSDDRPSCLENPRPDGTESSLTENVNSPFQAEPAHGQKEHSDLKYFWGWEKRLDEIEGEDVRQEISAYRNKGHDIPAIIGCAWEKKGGKFLHHFLPTIAGHQGKESVDMNTQLQQYFEFVANVWLSFVPGDLKSKFPRSFQFPVTIPNSYLGELPPELQKPPQLVVSMEAYNREEASK